MKKQFLQLLLSLLFLIVTAMTCEDEYPVQPTSVPCTIKGVELLHWDNTGEHPKEPVDNRIPKEAYILEICISTVEASDETESYYDNHYTQHVLSDAIKKIRIFAETGFNEESPAEADVTSYFYNYPKTIDKYQQTDYTAEGGLILYVDKINRIYKALMTIPQPEIYRFRVVLTMESGEIIERVSEPIFLY